MTKVPQSTTAIAPILPAMRNAACALLIGICFSPTAPALDFTPDEQAVWQMEEQYWRDVQAGDVESYLTLWHENFVGWPCFAWEPSDKSNIGGWVRDIRDNHWKLTYQLRPYSVRVTGDVATALYAAEYITEYGDGTKSGTGIWRKFTHTWIKRDGRWQIITGMCAAQEPVKTPRA
jgi:ketosteroid isomerase-like protein